MGFSDVLFGKKKYEQQTQEGFNCFLALGTPVCTELPHRVCSPEIQRIMLFSACAWDFHCPDTGRRCSLSFAQIWLDSLSNGILNHHSFPLSQPEVILCAFLQKSVGAWQWAQPLPFPYTQPLFTALFPTRNKKLYKQMTLHNRKNVKYM